MLQSTSSVEPDEAIAEWATLDDEWIEMSTAQPLQVEFRQILISPEQHGMRFDMALSLVLEDFSRSYVHTLIAQQRVKALNSLGQGFLKPSTKVKAGQQFEVEIRPSLQSQAYKPQPMEIETIFEDDHLRVIAKPAGLVVHPAPGNWTGTLLNGLLALDQMSWHLPRAGIVHRLDKDTTGLMVVARTRACMDALTTLISQRQIKRQYLALVHHAWQGSGRDVELPIGRDPRQRLRMAVVDQARYPGKYAKTHFDCLDSNDQASLLHCTLSTGRTHQIRVHLSHLGHPLVGDALYGGKSLAQLARQALHAHRLGFLHPMTGKACQWIQPLPTDMMTALETLGLSYNP
ncbi:MAG: RluA family pseudouridine synthase [Betaproteobacteria bacterium]|nr:RluA family pseudouridine synthase [Betaproteobacteria bacterium]NBY05707.1 RluA family pseudouridine synthase [Betaproteobacteria bacterium]